MDVNHQILGVESNHIYPRKLETPKIKLFLNENDKIISNNEEVAVIFNDYFVTVADGTGKDNVFNPSDHDSCQTS